MNQFTWYTISIVEPQIYIRKVLRFALVIRWIELKTVCYLSIPPIAMTSNAFPCLWSDHSLNILHSRKLAQVFYVFWYHSFLIRTRIFFQTSSKQPVARRLPFCHSWFGYSPRYSLCKLNFLLISLLTWWAQCAPLLNAFEDSIFSCSLLVTELCIFQI